MERKPSLLNLVQAGLLYRVSLSCSLSLFLSPNLREHNSRKMLILFLSEEELLIIVWLNKCIEVSPKWISLEMIQKLLMMAR